MLNFDNSIQFPYSLIGPVARAMLNSRMERLSLQKTANSADLA